MWWVKPTHHLRGTKPVPLQESEKLIQSHSRTITYQFFERKIIMLSYTNLTQNKFDLHDLAFNLLKSFIDNEHSELLFNKTIILSDYLDEMVPDYLSVNEDEFMLVLSSAHEFFDFTNTHDQFGRDVSLIRLNPMVFTLSEEVLNTKSHEKIYRQSGAWLAKFYKLVTPFVHDYVIVDANDKTSAQEKRVVRDFLPSAHNDIEDQCITFDFQLTDELEDKGALLNYLGTQDYFEVDWDDVKLNEPFKINVTIW